MVGRLNSGLYGRDDTNRTRNGPGRKSLTFRQSSPRLGRRLPGIRATFGSQFHSVWWEGVGVDSRVRVILVTDGDKSARRAVEQAADRFGMRCISASAGNPTPLSGPELIALIKQAAYDPVLVMVDDKGNPGTGPGETALTQICKSPEIFVLGAIAVASNTRWAKGTRVDISITRDGKVVHCPVDKDGHPEPHRKYLKGDTVDALSWIELPIIVGIGDPGKMEGADCHQVGCTITARAVLEVLSHAIGQSPIITELNESIDHL